MRQIVRVALVFVAALECDEPQGAQRLRRTFGWETGSPFQQVYSVEQDPEGFLWIGSHQGYFRYDGNEFKRVLPAESFAGQIKGCTGVGRQLVLVPGPAPAGEQIVELRSGMASPISRPPTATDLPIGDRACSEHGALWLVIQGHVFRQLPDGGWKQVVESDPLDPVRRIFRGRDGGMLLATLEELREIDRYDNVSTIARIRAVGHAVIDNDHSILALTWRRDGGHLHRLTPGSNRELLHWPGRPMALEVRHGTAWVGFDGALIAVSSDGMIENLDAGRPHSFDKSLNAADLVFDQEGALWVAEWHGVSIFSQPETRAFVHRATASRWLTRRDGKLLTSSWDSTALVETDGSTPRIEPFPLPSIAAFCVDPSGRTWGGLFDGLTLLDKNGAVSTGIGGPIGDVGPCAIDRSGAVWFPTNEGLFRLAPQGTRPVPVQARSEAIHSALVDSQGMLWIGNSEGAVCYQHPEQDPIDQWHCEQLPLPRPVFDLIETSRGEIWACSRGIHRRLGPDRWESLQTSDRSVELTHVAGLAPSPKGGIWALGAGVVVRLADRVENATVATLERLGAWQGMPVNGAKDAIEEPDGTIWLSGGLGLIQVPARAREVARVPTRVAITALRADQTELPIQGDFTLPYQSNRLEVRASAFSYRDPARIRYRYRLRDRDDWSESVSDPVFRFYNLAPGDYSLSVAASLSGADWTSITTSVPFRVLRPWYLHPLFFACLIAVAAATGWWLYRLRVTRLLSLERQRARIAMDLHDAIGSGLGSIGLLAGVGARASSAPEQRQVLSDQIAKIAAELGMSLSEIVWSLRPGSEQLSNLASYLKERAHLLFDPSRVRFETVFPENWPDLALSLPMQRNLMAIALEALGNAARHARPTRIELGIQPRQRGWLLWVDDDGLGLAAGVNPGTGMGLDNMRRRAQEIGGEIEIGPGSGNSGTRVQISFDPSR